MQSDPELDRLGKAISEKMVDKPADPIVAAVIDDLKSRSQRGIKTYGTTLARTDLTEREWAQNHYEELLDTVLYLRRRMADMP